ncbi:MAG: GIY-YIG nuclease family protein, partial [Acidobacteriota bacterium]
MRRLAVQDAILAHLRAAGAPATSRELADRFLRIRHEDEEVCFRLLARILSDLPGVVHRPGSGWSFGTEGAAAPPARPSPGAGEAATPVGGSLIDFVALAADGGGPRRSGAPRVVTLLPVAAGRPGTEVSFPSWAAAAEDFPRASSGQRRSGRAGLSSDDLQALLRGIGGGPVICHRIGHEIDPVRAACLSAGLAFHPPVVSTAKLGRVLFGLKRNHAALDLAAILGVEARGPDDCRGRARLAAVSFLAMVPLLEERGIASLGPLLEYQDMPPAPVDLSRYRFSADDLRDLPRGPGIYLFRDRGGRVIYVGKARSLRTRVSSYFAPSARASAKGRSILEQVHSLEVEPVASELEALLLEAALLSEHRPGLNRQFEVHERPAPYGPRLNLVVVLKDEGSGETPLPCCTLHLLRMGR